MTERKQEMEKLRASVESKNKEILALSTEVTRLKMEVCGISERADSAQKAAIAQTCADHAIKLLSKRASFMAKSCSRRCARSFEYLSSGRIG